MSPLLGASYLQTINLSSHKDTKTIPLFNGHTSIQRPSLVQTTTNFPHHNFINKFIHTHAPTPTPTHTHAPTPTHYTHTRTHAPTHTHYTHVHTHYRFPSSKSHYEDTDDLILDDLFMDADLLSTATPTMEEDQTPPHQPTEEQPSTISPIEAGKHQQGSY